MANYIGKVQIGTNGDQILIGSTMYGTCETLAATAAKVVTLSDFNAIMNGITIHVNFINGNTVTTGVTLQVGSTNAYSVTGNCVCNANEVVSFTLEQGDSGTYWRAERSIRLETSNNILTSIDGQEVNIATKTYVDNKTAGLSGLTGAMHFRGETTNSDGNGNPILPTDANSFANYDSGDVILVGNQEYVYSKGINAAASEWILLGDEGSYALKTSTANIGTASEWSAGALPTLGTDIDADDITSWSEGTASSATVTNGVLHLINSTVPTLQYSAKTIPNITSVGTLPSLTTGSTTVVVP